MILDNKKKICFVSKCTFFKNYRGKKSLGKQNLITGTKLFFHPFQGLKKRKLIESLYKSTQFFFVPLHL